MVANVKKALLYLLASYWLVSLLVVLIIIILGGTYQLPSASDLQVSVGQSPAYLMSMPLHPLVNLPFWFLFGCLYLKRINRAEVRREGLRLGLFWAGVSIVLDYFVWVLIPSPIQMTHREMYVEYQPWLTLIYLVIFLGPLVAGNMLAARSRKQAVQGA